MSKIHYNPACSHAQGSGKSYAEGVMTWPDVSAANPFSKNAGKGGGAKGGLGGQPPGNQPPKGPPITMQDRQKIDDVKQILARSSNGKALLDFAAANGIKIDIDPNPNVYGYYSPADRKIGLNPRGDEGQLVATLAHELRHAWQDQHGLLDRLTRSPEDIVWMTRLVEADAEANAIQICWELRENGYPQAFAAHQRTGYADESMAFEMAVAANPAAATNGQAMRVAFDQWFSRPWRRDAYDKGATDWMEFVMDFYRRSVPKSGFVKPQLARLEAKLGETPSGDRNYITAHKSKYHDLDAECYRGGIQPAIEQRLAHIRSFFKFNNGKNINHERVPKNALRRGGRKPGSRSPAGRAHDPDDSAMGFTQAPGNDSLRALSMVDRVRSAARHRPAFQSRPAFAPSF